MSYCSEFDSQRHQSNLSDCDSGSTFNRFKYVGKDDEICGYERNAVEQRAFKGINDGAAQRGVGNNSSGGGSGSLDDRVKLNNPYFFQQPNRNNSIGLLGPLYSGNLKKNRTAGQPTNLGQVRGTYDDEKDGYEVNAYHRACLSPSFQMEELALESAGFIDEDDHLCPFNRSSYPMMKGEIEGHQVFDPQEIKTTFFGLTKEDIEEIQIADKQHHSLIEQEESQNYDTDTYPEIEILLKNKSSTTLKNLVAVPNQTGDDMSIVGFYISKGHGIGIMPDIMIWGNQAFFYIPTTTNLMRMPSEFSFKLFSTLHATREKNEVLIGIYKSKNTEYALKKRGKGPLAAKADNMDWTIGSDSHMCENSHSTKDSYLRQYNKSAEQLATLGVKNEPPVVRHRAPHSLQMQAPTGATAKAWPIARTGPHTSSHENPHSTNGIHLRQYNKSAEQLATFGAKNERPVVHHRAPHSLQMQATTGETAKAWTIARTGPHTSSHENPHSTKGIHLRQYNKSAEQLVPLGVKNERPVVHHRAPHSLQMQATAGATAKAWPIARAGPQTFSHNKSAVQLATLGVKNERPVVHHRAPRSLQMQATTGATAKAWPIARAGPHSSSHI